MSGDQLDLDAVVARSQQAQNCRSGMAPANRPAQDALWTLCREDVPALVAEVRRLREDAAVVARHRFCRDCGATFEQCQRYRLGRAIKCCPDCRHDPA